MSGVPKWVQAACALGVVAVGGIYLIACIGALPTWTKHLLWLCGETCSLCTRARSAARADEMAREAL